MITLQPNNIYLKAQNNQILIHHLQKLTKTTVFSSINFSKFIVFHNWSTPPPSPTYNFDKPTHPSDTPHTAAKHEPTPTCCWTYSTIPSQPDTHLPLFGSAGQTTIDFWPIRNISFYARLSFLSLSFIAFALHHFRTLTPLTIFIITTIFKYRHLLYSLQSYKYIPMSNIHAFQNIHHSPILTKQIYFLP